MCVKFTEYSESVTLYLPQRLSFDHIDCFKHSSQRLDLGDRRIYIDTSGLHELDFAGLGILINFKKDRASDLPVYWSNASDYAARIFEACRLERYFQREGDAGQSTFSVPRIPNSGADSPAAIDP